MKLRATCSSVWRSQRIFRTFRKLSIRITSAWWGLEAMAESARKLWTSMFCTQPLQPKAKGLVLGALHLCQHHNAVAVPWTFTGIMVTLPSYQSGQPVGTKQQSPWAMGWEWGQGGRLGCFGHPCNCSCKAQAQLQASGDCGVKGWTLPWQLLFLRNQT